MFRQKLQQKLQQRLSPLQIQYVRLLELPAMEMEERVKQELEENPILEEGLDTSLNDEDDAFDTEEPDVFGENESDLSLGDYLTEDDIPDYKLAEISSQAERKEDIPFSSGPSLHEYLSEQLGLRDLSEQEQRIGEYIIGNIDDNGYLRRNLTAITDDLIFKAGEDVKDAEVQAVLTVVQDFEPTGVAARNLQECLLLQLERKTQTPYTQQAIEILRDHFDAFARKHYEKIQKIMNINETSLKHIIHEITSLNPKPGNSWNSGGADTTMNQITPDFVVEAHNGELTLSMNQRGIPDLHISREYTAMFQDYMGNKANQTSDMREAVQFVKQKLDAAQWFIEALQQRHETLQRTMQTIIVMQRDFFLSGDESKLHPMILKDVAENSGYDISTISRVSNSKYVQTNFGIFPLKFFFSESTQNDSGEEISTREVKQIMKETIDAEDKHKPITDEEIAMLLKKKGYVIARRTVAKYREHLDIPVARLRKEL
ncbi:MAG: RNA polymerase factor sigma-54 [Tannerella sp.]|jgi:RNA polymerase sigma-54 factor|nr:RNA polymerase factor sigma-54 [Tannerella sp.]